MKVRRIFVPGQVLITLEVSVLQKLLDGLALVHLVGRKRVSSPKEGKHGTGGELCIVGGPDHGWGITGELVRVVNIGSSCGLEFGQI